jgi:DNA modification methylase
MKIINSDCIEAMKQMADNSIDAIVTDPPYELGFMGKSWDSTGIAFNVEVWQQALRVLKPGAHLIAFSGSRTYHRMAVAIEDAGFEIRDQIMWVYGSGFPKSMNIGKAIDKIGGVNLSWFIDYILEVADERKISRKELIDLFPSKNGNPTGWLWNKRHTQGLTLEQYHIIKDFLDLPFENIEECERKVVGRGTAGLTSGNIANFSGEKEFDITEGNSEWEGWGTALKPAHEPMVLARKPLEGTVANNVLTYGTGGLNIDASRIGSGSGETKTVQYPDMRGNNYNNASGTVEYTVTDQGRFPANFIHDGSDEVVGLFPDTKAATSRSRKANRSPFSTGEGLDEESFIYPDSGSAARFFYCAKTSKADRNEGLDDFPTKQKIFNGQNDTSSDYVEGSVENKFTTQPSANHHPTVKPTELMRYLCKLITPPKGVILDPFMGSGSTGKGAVKEGFDFIGIDQSSEYCEIARARIEYALETLPEFEQEQLL